MVTLPARRAGVLTRLLLASLVFAPGCVLFSKVQLEEQKAVAAAIPAGPRPTAIALLWQPSIIEAPDPTRGGNMNPGLGGQMLLTGANGVTDYFDGTLTVIAHDISACGPHSVAQPVFLYRWTWPPEILRQLQKETSLGKGYTLYCPFPPGVYRPGISRLQLQVAFQSAGSSAPLYSDPSKVSLGSHVNGSVASSGPQGQMTVTSNKPK